MIARAAIVFALFTVMMISAFQSREIRVVHVGEPSYLNADRPFSVR